MILRIYIIWVESFISLKKKKKGYEKNHFHTNFTDCDIQ